MGKGDRKTRRGKIWRGTFGKTRLKSNKEKKKEEKQSKTNSSQVTAS
ncbi:MAG: 30S ribosomal protein THX [Candidatus Hydrogenedentes bacterium]|nr:30S ribosomal protein THX [Candidatus Hydrogenedentota bacterium]